MSWDNGYVHRLLDLILKDSGLLLKTKYATLINKIKYINHADLS